MDSQTLVAQMQELGLWPEQASVRAELWRLQQRLPDAVALARELLDRNLLTPYQANQLLRGQGKQLLVGHYQVLERLGEGAMAQVFKARHRHMQRLAALKVIRREWVANPVAVARFLREVQAAAALAHPNIVRAYDAGQVEDSYYLAMEFINGIDLHRLVGQEGPLAVDRACEYVRQAAEGLQHIHKSGMIHRDIKPGNLMVTLVSGGVPRSEGPEATAAARGLLPTLSSAPLALHQIKILDLGLARLREEAGADAPEALTRLGHIVGTPDFMAPEQALHSPQADIRSDIYSLGCTFYFLLAGHPPFPGGGSVEKILRHQLDAPRPIEELRPDLPPAVRWVLGKMLAKNPDDRFPWPQQVADALHGAREERLVAIPLLPEEKPSAAPAASSRALAAVVPSGGNSRTGGTLPGDPPSGSEVIEPFNFEEAGSSSLILTPRPNPSPTRSANWRLWVVLACAGLAACLALIVGLMLRLR